MKEYLNAWLNLSQEKKNKLKGDGAVLAVQEDGYVLRYVSEQVMLS